MKFEKVWTFFYNLPFYWHFLGLKWKNILFCAGKQCGKKRRYQPLIQSTILSIKMYHFWKPQLNLCHNLHSPTSSWEYMELVTVWQQKHYNTSVWFLQPLLGLPTRIILTRTIRVFFTIRPPNTRTIRVPRKIVILTKFWSKI